MTLFPPRREPLVNYDWVDVASATGYVQYDGYVTVDSVGTNHSLVRASDASGLFSIVFYETVASTTNPHIIIIGTQSDSETYTKQIDVSFDLDSFKLPRVIRGKSYLKLGICSDHGADDMSYYVIARLKKNNVEIVNVQSVTFISTTDGRELPISLEFDVPQTHFKKGDYVRLTIECWARNDIVSANFHRLAITADPQNRADSYTLGAVDFDFTAGNTRLIITLPYKIDL